MKQGRGGEIVTVMFIADLSQENLRGLGQMSVQQFIKFMSQ